MPHLHLSTPSHPPSRDAAAAAAAAADDDGDRQHRRSESNMHIIGIRAAAIVMRTELQVGRGHASLIMPLLAVYTADRDEYRMDGRFQP